MGLLGKKEGKEEKRAKDVAKYLEKYKLNDIGSNDLEVIKQISNDLAGTGLIRAGMALSFANAAEQAKVNFLSALVKQNWIIIRKLDDLNKNLS